MNAELPRDPREELEAQVTALLLGELPEPEAAALRETIAKDPELVELRERLERTIGLVRETAATPAAQVEGRPAPLKLSAQRREQLLQQFKTIRPKEFAGPRWWQLRSPALTAAAAVLVLMALVAGLLPVLSRTKTTSHSPQLTFGTWGIKGDKFDAEPTHAQRMEPVGAAGLDEDITGKALLENGAARRSPAKPVDANGARRSLLAADNSMATRSTSASTSPTGGAHDRRGSTDAIVLPAKSPATATEVAYNLQSSTVQSVTNGFFTGLTLDDVGGFRSLSGANGTATALPAAPTLAPPPPAPASASFSRIILPDNTEVAQTPTRSLGSDVPHWDIKVSNGLDAFKVAEKGLPGPTVSQGFFNDGKLDAAQDGVLAWSGAIGASGGGGGGFGGRGASTMVGDGRGPGTNGVYSLNVAGYADVSGEKAKLDQAAGYNFDRQQAGTAGQKNLFAGNTFVGGGAKSEIGPSGTPTATTATPMLGLPADATKGLAAAGTVSAPGGNLETLNLRKRDLNRIEPGRNEILLGTGNPRTTRSTSGSSDVTTGRISGGSRPPNGSLFAESKPKSVYGPPGGMVLAAAPAASENLAGSTKEAKDVPFLADKVTVGKLFTAKRDLEEQRRLGDAMQMKLNSEKADLDAPKTSMVEIVDAATPPAKARPLYYRFIEGGGDYESVARVRIQRDQSDIAGLQDSKAATSYDPYFVQTELETIRSKAVLDGVVKDLKLTETWGKKAGKTNLPLDEARELLKKSLDLRVAKDTGLLEIGAKSDSPEVSASIANAVAKAYQQNRQEQRRQTSIGGIASLEVRNKDQARQLAAAQAEVDRLAVQIKPAEKNNSDPTPPKPAIPAPIPQPEVRVRENAFSTFSLNVSDVSFKLAGASLEQGVLPEPGSIRSEEFINAFDYRDPEPAAGAPMTFAWDRARYPFAQNRDLVRFSLKTAAQGRQAGRPLNLVLLLDKSGSMERADRVNIVREALRVLATQLQARDKFSVVIFARTARLAADGVPGDQADKVGEEVAGLTPDGGTNLEEAMKLAYDTARRHYLADGINRVVLLTDGAANLGNVDPESLQQRVEANRKQGVALDCFGIGWEGYNDDLLEVLTRHGDGRYGFLNAPEEAATQFAGQLAGALRMAASDVKVQVEFNPARVNSYRQIGYARHQLTQEQFRDNTVDAAEIGAAESGNALYVIEVNAAGQGPLATVRVRYKVPGTTDYREQEWSVPYQGGAVALDQAGPALRLAASASAFSEWLASSPYATEVTPDRLLNYLRGVPEVYGADARPKKLEWMIRQTKALGK